MRRVAAERTASTFNDHNREMFCVPASAHLPHQFANLYFSRLCELRPKVEAAAVAKWGSSILDFSAKTLDVTSNTTALVVGTIYRDMKMKPNVMDEITRDVLEQPAEKDAEVVKYSSDDDDVFLEDDSGRLALRLPKLWDGMFLFTGVVVAVRGRLTDGGQLAVDDICFPGLAPQRALPSAKATQERFVALVSGLHIGHSTKDMLPLQMLAEHLTGQLGCDEDHRLQANIVRLVVAGNATCAPTSSPTHSSNSDWQPTDVLKKMSAPDQKALAQNMRNLDQFLTAVSSSIPVDLMPGNDDPCNLLMPQQPLHACMLPHSAQLATLNLCTNPYCCDIDGVRMLGSSGQPLDDMQR